MIFNKTIIIYVQHLVSCLPFHIQGALVSGVLVKSSLTLWSFSPDWPLKAVLQVSSWDYGKKSKYELLKIRKITKPPSSNNLSPRPFYAYPKSSGKYISPGLYCGVQVERLDVWRNIVTALDIGLSFKYQINHKIKIALHYKTGRWNGFEIFL